MQWREFCSSHCIVHLQQHMPKEKNAESITLTGEITMTIEECYQQLGGDYSEVVKRLSALTLIKKFISKFLQDKSFENLCGEIQSGNRIGAFRASHTLKGVCQNLGFGKLMISSEKLTEALRADGEEIPESAAAVFENVRRDYEETTAVICRYLTSELPSEADLSFGHKV